jgi:hypothetical protein
MSDQGWLSFPASDALKRRPVRFKKRLDGENQNRDGEIKKRKVEKEK